MPGQSWSSENEKLGPTYLETVRIKPVLLQRPL